MTTFLLGVPLCEPIASTALTTSMPSITWPKTTCLPSSHEVLTVQRKNLRAARRSRGQTASVGSAGGRRSGLGASHWEPFVPGPALAMDRMPGPVCLSLKFSSSNLAP